MEEDKYRILQYEFPNVDFNVVWLEEILKEFQIETEKVWYRLDDITGKEITSKEEPLCPELYSILYTSLADVNDNNSYFAEYLIEDLLSVTGFLEGCLQKEIEDDNERQDDTDRTE